MSTTCQTLLGLKGERPIVAITAYDAVMAHFVDAAGVDLILVGDSVGTTQLGFESTVPVTTDMMVHHTAAVTRAQPKALVVADVPFGVAAGSFAALLECCVRLLQEGGAEAVKLEGGARLAESIERLVDAGIPVLGHIGLLPQQIYRLGGYRRFGRTDREKERLLDDAVALQSAGCFGIVGEMLEGTLAGSIASTLKIPLIGIGSGPHCDGQILVANDLLGWNPGKVPSFVKQYAALGERVTEAVSAFAAEVREGRFPE